MNDNNHNNIIFISIFISLIFLISLFNYIVDPYYILRDSTIKGFNNVKTHKYTNKRTILYSDIKLNHKNKDIAFTGNCLLSHYGSGLDNIAFFTIPMAKIGEVLNTVKTIHTIAPNIKKIYLGLFFDEMQSHKNEETTDSLPILESNNFTYKDFINLFFSWNTTQYSIETVRDSIRNKGKDIVYIYPYREIAKKEYTSKPSLVATEKIKNICEYAKDNNIELIIYYSPIHITKKIHIYTKNQWDNNQEFKRRLSKITSFYDYSFLNDYNSMPLDKNSVYFIDNIHPTNIYNNLVVKDLLAKEKKIGILINSENAEEYLKKDTQQLENFMKKHKGTVEKIKKVTIDDFYIKIKKDEK